ncbi:MAG: S46 family peptidase, partial [Bacteroidales bacterium]|nr:S46 family peptidase [Bacteroidales bacterium]
MKHSFLTFLAAALIGLTTFAASPRPDEGMWLPMFVDRLNWTDIQEMGLQLTAEELYSINNSSLKDAIVGLASGSAPGGYFCTGEMVSDQGLLFTNHHCGYDIIQNHSTIEHDYLTDGFWAMNFSEELSNPNLTASFLVRMEDLNPQILPQLSDTMTGAQRAAKVRELTKDIKDEAAEDGKYDVVVKSFFGGNEYYLFVYETFKDVRLVGAPPSSIGKFGGDTDNWMWPRHTGDFSIFRVYCAPDGSPAEYAEENVPFRPRHHLPVSLKGYKNDDFAMIWGYPGGTDRYLTSYGIDYALEGMNPTIINLFGSSLEVMKSYMDADDAMRIKYASDHAGMANFWKYTIGQSRGLKRLDVKSQKEQIEKDFTNWVNQNPQRKEKYGDVLENIQGGYKQLDGVVSPFYYAAIGSGNVDLLSMAAMAGQLTPMLDDT